MKKYFLQGIALKLFLPMILCAAESSYESVENDINYPLLNPSLVDRKVEKIRLKNGINAYLISDPETKQSAAGLAVEAGSWQDPKEYPGMAHFLEHMLFMGNEAYPEEFEYMHYVTEHGGKVNASTWPDRTIYMFSINNDAFEGCLDRFSHFFIDPLFLTSCIQRELHAVDQEHAKNIEHDGWRQYMVFKETGNPEHPNASFSTGNAKTLGGIPQEALKKWYESHYSSEKMHLILLSPLPMEQLRSLAVETFSKVPLRNTEERAPLPELLTSAEQRGRMIFLKTVKDLKILSIMWEIPSEFCEWERRPASLVSYVLNSEADNSLLAELKREKLAEAIKADSALHAKGKLLFTLDIQLTPQGMQQTDTVITQVFQTLARLKQNGIGSYLFQEIQKMSALDYQYQSREDAFEFISKHAHDIVDEKFESYPEKTRILSTYDPEFLSAFLQTFTPENCIYFVQGDPEKIGIRSDRKEKWMGAEYTIKEIPQEKLTAWAKVKPNPRISLPSPNPFLPDISTISLEQKVDESPVVPSLLADDSWGKVYYATDKRYLVPEIYASFALKTPHLDGTAKAAVLSDLYIRALQEKLSSTIWFAQTAGLHPHFDMKDLKFTISLSGYVFKAPLLLKEIFGGLKSVQPTREHFELYKQSLLSDYDNHAKELPLRQALDLLQSVVYSDAPTFSEKLTALKETSYEEFLAFSKNLFKTTFTEGLVYGNVQENDVQTLYEELKNALGSSPMPITAQRRKQILLLPESRGPYLISQKTPRQGNGVVLFVEQGNFSFEKKASQEILAKALQEAFFDTLRTKQQTAYIARAWAYEEEKQLLQLFAVQSSSHHPSDLIARFELFIEDFLKRMPEHFPLTRFQEMQNTQIVTLQMPPENLPSMGRRLARLAFDHDGDFSRFEKQVTAVSKLKYEQFLADAEKFLSRNNLRRLAILMEGVLTPENDFRYERVSKEDICDLGVYISSK
jgi:insulysin